MEPHQGKPEDAGRWFFGWDEELEVMFEHAFAYAEEFHSPTLERYREIDVADLTPHLFWSEYLWVVYCSGFTPKVITGKFNGLMNAYGPWDFLTSWTFIWSRVQPVFANRVKCKNALKCRELMKSSGWDNFRAAYCTSIDELQQLPFIGAVTKYHLARNIGFDAVKSDLHLVRLARTYGFAEPDDLCYFLGGFSDERIGVVDFVLWAYSAAFGTATLV